MHFYYLFFLIFVLPFLLEREYLYQRISHLFAIIMIKTAGEKMCYAIPAKITKICKDNAVADYGGIIKKINISLVSGLAPGDFVLIHAGFAIEKLDRKSAKAALKEINRDLEMIKKPKPKNA